MQGLCYEALLATAGPSGVGGKRARNSLDSTSPGGDSSLHQACAGSLHTADAAPPKSVTASDQPESDQPPLQDMSDKPCHQLPLQVPQLQQEVLNELCSNLPTGDHHWPGGYRITYGHHGQMSSYKDEAAGGAVQGAFERWAALTACCSHGGSTAATDSSDKHSQPCAASLATQHEQATAAECHWAAANTNTGVLRQTLLPKQMPQAPPASDSELEQAIATQLPMTAAPAPAETSRQQQPSQLLVSLGQVLLQLQQKRKAQTLGRKDAQHQHDVPQSSAGSAGAVHSGSGMNVSMHLDKDASVQDRASQIARLTEVLGPHWSQAYFNLGIAAAAPLENTPPIPLSPLAAVMMPGAGDNSNLLPVVATQEQNMLAATTVGGCDISSVSAPCNVNSTPKLPILQLPQAMRVSYLRAAGFLPPQGIKRARPTSSKANGSIPLQRSKRSHDSDTSTVGQQERSYMLGSNSQRIWEEHKVVMRIMQVVVADIPGAAECLRETTQMFEARFCVSCWRVRPMNGSWYCKKVLCRKQHKKNYEGQSVTAATMRAHDEALWQEVKGRVQPVPAAATYCGDIGDHGSKDQQERATVALVQASDASAMPELSSVAPPAATTASASLAPPAAHPETSTSASQEAAGTAAAAKRQHAASGVQGKQPVNSSSNIQVAPSAIDPPSADGVDLQAALVAIVPAQLGPGTTSSAAAAVVVGLPANAGPTDESAVMSSAAVKNTTAAAHVGQLPSFTAAVAASQGAVAASAVLYTPPEVPIKDFILPEKHFKPLDMQRLWWEHQLHMRVLLMKLEDKPRILARVQDVIHKMFNRKCLRCLSHHGHKPIRGGWFCIVCQQAWGKSQQISDGDAWKAVAANAGLHANYMLSLGALPMS